MRPVGDAVADLDQEQVVHSWALVYLGLTALVAGRVPDAATFCKEALTRKRPVGDLLGGPPARSRGPDQCALAHRS